MKPIRSQKVRDSHVIAYYKYQAAKAYAQYRWLAEYYYRLKANG